jgi:hypothetical protein
VFSVVEVFKAWERKTYWIEGEIRKSFNHREHRVPQRIDTEEIRIYLEGDVDSSLGAADRIRTTDASRCDNSPTVSRRQ